MQAGPRTTGVALVHGQDWPQPVSCTACSCLAAPKPRQVKVAAVDSDRSGGRCLAHAPRNVSIDPRSRQPECRRCLASVRQPLQNRSSAYKHVKQRLPLTRHSTLHYYRGRCLADAPKNTGIDKRVHVCRRHLADAPKNTSIDDRPCILPMYADTLNGVQQRTCKKVPGSACILLLVVGGWGKKSVCFGLEPKWQTGFQPTSIPYALTQLLYTHRMLCLT